MDMVPSALIILISLTSLLLVTGDNNLIPKNNSTAVYEEAKYKFNKLLDAIAYVNEKRLNALKRYTDLEWSNPTAGVLRDIETENNHHISRINKINHEHTKDIIEDALHDILCKHTSRKSTETKKSKTKYKFKQIIKNYLRANAEIPNNSKFYYRSRISSRKDKNLRKNDYKESLRSSCWREAYKSCKKACKSALSYVCASYSCGRGLKNRFEKDCRNNCKYRLG